MRIAVLPFNAAEGARPALARQIVNFCSEVLKESAGAELDVVGYLAQVEEEGITKIAQVNPSTELNDGESVQQVFGQSKAERVVDGLFEETGDGGKLTVRVFERGKEDPLDEKVFEYTDGTVFEALRGVIGILESQSGKSLPAEIAEGEELFGTKDSDAFLDFLEGYDAAQYVERTQGQVVEEFSPELPMNSLLSAAEADRGWEAPYLAFLQLARLCINYRAADPDLLEEKLERAVEVFPEEAGAFIVLGELLQAKGEGTKAIDAYQKASDLQPEDPAIHTRMGLVQMNIGMPANAEQSLRKALEMEGPDKPSLDLLAATLSQTGRQHEVPDLYKNMADEQPDNPVLFAKHAMALLNVERFDEGEKLFEEGIQKFEDNVVIKRAYAPYLVQRKKDFDTALDYYEDAIEANQQDIALLVEYAQALEGAGRTVDLPDVLNNILALDPDSSTRTLTKGRLIELEQPERIEKIKDASQMVEAGNPKEAVDLLLPMRNWLGDYWKLWGVLASAHNKLGEAEEAEQAARRLLEMHPRFEPGYIELSNALAKQGRADEAYALMRVARGNMQNSLPIAIGFAVAAKRAGNTEEASKMAESIKQATNNDPGVLEALKEAEGGSVIKLPFSDD